MAPAQRLALLVLLLRWCCVSSSEAEGLAVALHAQAYPAEGGYIVGSVMTTNGLKRALLRSGRVRVAKSFYPFHYTGLDDEAWDVLLIEGWFEMSNALIHEMRRQNPKIAVFYWCLDPLFPGLDAISALDVDGYLTNSESIQRTLGAVAPTALAYLAADPEVFAAAPLPDDDAAPPRPLIYVGSALGIETKKNLVAMLREAAFETALGLDLWGSGWGSVGPSDLADCCYRGLLPPDALAGAYANASGVLGATMDGQRDAGMVNNRVFEALAAGAPLIQEAFPELEALLADAPPGALRPG